MPTPIAAGCIIVPQPSKVAKFFSDHAQRDANMYKAAMCKTSPRPDFKMLLGQHGRFFCRGRLQGQMRGRSDKRRRTPRRLRKRASKSGRKRSGEFGWRHI